MRKKFYITLDTETATLPFVNQMELSAKQKQNIAIAKPLIYDIGWTIADRNGEIYEKKNFLIQETFFVPNVFNTAYYCDKRPIYLQLLREGKIITKTWDEAATVLLHDMERCDYVTAYNAAFDFKKAIPFTERYIRNLYSSKYNEWEARQRELCEGIKQGKYNAQNETYLNPVFEFRGLELPIIDLWGYSCERLLNNQRYKDFCLKNGFLTQSGLFFSTSAEKTFSYLIKNNEYIEEHTALEDALIETEILAKILKRGKIEPEIGCFPFKTLGETHEYITQNKKIKYAETIIDTIEEALGKYERQSAYTRRLENIIMKLNDLVQKEL